MEEREQEQLIHFVFAVPLFFSILGTIPSKDIGLAVRSMNKCPSEAELAKILKKVR